MKNERIVTYTREEIEERIARGESRMDWERIENMTDEEIERNALEDPDSQEFLDESLWENAVPVIPEPKEQISIRLDPDVLAWFRRSGSGYQTRINAVLRSYMDAQKSRA